MEHTNYYRDFIANKVWTRFQCRVVDDDRSKIIGGRLYDADDERVEMVASAGTIDEFRKGKDTYVGQYAMTLYRKPCGEYFLALIMQGEEYLIPLSLDEDIIKVSQTIMSGDAWNAEFGEKYGFVTE